jgi:hypothetical protein
MRRPDDGVVEQIGQERLTGAVIVVKVPGVVCLAFAQPRFRQGRRGGGEEIPPLIKVLSCRVLVPISATNKDHRR